jgi:hypothetical protein
MGSNPPTSFIFQEESFQKNPSRRLFPQDSFFKNQSSRINLSGTKTSLSFCNGVAFQHQCSIRHIVLFLHRGLSATLLSISNYSIKSVGSSIAKYSRLYLRTPTEATPTEATPTEATPTEATPTKPNANRTIARRAWLPCNNNTCLCYGAACTLLVRLAIPPTQKGKMQNG